MIELFKTLFGRKTDTAPAAPVGETVLFNAYCTCLEIAQRTITVVPGITGLIDRLEQKSLVQRQRCSKARRMRDVVDLPDATEPATPMMKGIW